MGVRMFAATALLVLEGGLTLRTQPVFPAGFGTNGLVGWSTVVTAAADGSQDPHAFVSNSNAESTGLPAVFSPLHPEVWADSPFNSLRWATRSAFNRLSRVPRGWTNVRSAFTAPSAGHVLASVANGSPASLPPCPCLG